MDEEVSKAILKSLKGRISEKINHLEEKTLSPDEASDEARCKALHDIFYEAVISLIVEKEKIVDKRECFYIGEDIILQQLLPIKSSAKRAQIMFRLSCAAGEACLEEIYHYATAARTLDPKNHDLEEYDRGLQQIKAEIEASS
ncbi:MAG: hypothetical protein P0S96_04915 [Simkaniaceae bacterium]|nr:hypothetical protein [Candidatus Sacchlamyda saccharinae]